MLAHNKQKELKPLDQVWVRINNKWHEALFWKFTGNKPVFTTDGITEITDCDWKYRE